MGECPADVRCEVLAQATRADHASSKVKGPIQAKGAGRDHARLLQHGVARVHDGDLGHPIQDHLERALDGMPRLLMAPGERVELVPVQLGHARPQGHQDQLVAAVRVRGGATNRGVQPVHRHLVQILHVAEALYDELVTIHAASEKP